MQELGGVGHTENPECRIVQRKVFNNRVTLSDLH